MSTTKEFKEFVVEQLSTVGDIKCRSMMGEYLLYCNGVLFGGIYDGRLLIKRTPNNNKFNLPEEIPYKGAKPMFMIENLDDIETMKEIILFTCHELRLID